VPDVLITIMLAITSWASIADCRDRQNPRLEARGHGCTRTPGWQGCGKIPINVTKLGVHLLFNFPAQAVTARKRCCGLRFVCPGREPGSNRLTLMAAFRAIPPAPRQPKDVHQQRRPGKAAELAVVTRMKKKASALFQFARIDLDNPGLSRTHTARQCKWARAAPFARPNTTNLTLPFIEGEAM